MLDTGSLQLRLILASAVWICLGFAAAFWLLSSIFLAQTSEAFYDELDVHVLEIERLVDEDENGDVFLVSQFSDPRYDEFKSGFYWLVRTNEETVLASGSFRGLELNLPANNYRTRTVLNQLAAEGPTGTLLYAEINTPSRASSDTMRQFIVGTDKRLLDEMVVGFNRRLALALSALALIMVTSAAFLLRAAMAPFDRLKNGMTAVRSGKTRQLDGIYPQEVQPLVTEFNSLLLAVSDMLQRARASAGNLAHGLKAPLTIITSESYEMNLRGEAESAAIIQKQSQLMRRHIDHHLARTRASIIARLPGMRTSLEKELKELISAMQALYKEKAITVEVDLERELFLTTDAHDLHEIIGNLLDNAFKFANSLVTISASKSAVDMIEISIEDDGQGLPQDARASVFNIGQRWDEQSPGNGLGLAIVKELVELYGGDVQLSDSSTGGLRVIVELPASE